MKILGYSERGMVNSLLYEIYNHKNSDALFRLLMEEAKFPFVDSPSLDGELNIIIESSLSNFGDPDVVVLIDSGDTKSTVFIEAKVAAQKNWSLRAHFTDFMECANGRKQNRKKKIMKVDSSNLFAQIYHKQKFILTPTFDALKSGVSFPEWSSNKCRKIGKEQSRCPPHSQTDQVPSRFRVLFDADSRQFRRRIDRVLLQRRVARLRVAGDSRMGYLALRLSDLENGGQFLRTKPTGRHARRIQAQPRPNLLTKYKAHRRIP